MENSNLNLIINLSLDQYDTLVESIAKAVALTHVLSDSKNVELLPDNVLRDYLWTLHDLVYHANQLCSTFKPNPPERV